MSSAFIPLLPDTVASSCVGPTATATLFKGGGPEDPGFTALMPSEAAAASAARGHHSETATAPAHERLPVVTLNRDGDKVTRIQVRCSCGEVVELDCVY